MKFVLVKLRDNLFALSQVSIIARSLLAMEIILVGIPMGKEYICIISKR